MDELRQLLLTLERAIAIINDQEKEITPDNLKTIGTQPYLLIGHKAYNLEDISEIKTENMEVVYSRS